MFTNNQVEIEAIAQLEKINFSLLPKRAEQESLFSSLLTLLPLSIGACIAIYFLIQLPLPFFSLSVVGIFILLVFLLWLGVKRVRLTAYALREQDFVLKKGVFWQQLTVVPFNRIQHIETHRGPVERKLNLATLKLYTAGGSGVDLKISGLDRNQAESIKQYMLNYISDDKKYEREHEQG